MKKLLVPLMFIAVIVAFYEANSENKNVYILVIAIVVFMLGMMQLSAKTPSKNKDNKDENV